jgi:3-oxoacyl-ACP reductase-like protein
MHRCVFNARHRRPRSLVFAQEAAMTNKIDLGGRNAIVTGGAQGIGRAIVERFLDSGATIAIWDRDIEFA